MQNIRLRDAKNAENMICRAAGREKYGPEYRDRCHGHHERRDIRQPKKIAAFPDAFNGDGDEQRQNDVQRHTDQQKQQCVLKRELKRFVLQRVSKVVQAEYAVHVTGIIQASDKRNQKKDQETNQTGDKEYIYRFFSNKHFLFSLIMLYPILMHITTFIHYKQYIIFMLL